MQYKELLHMYKAVKNRANLGFYYKKF